MNKRQVKSNIELKREYYSQPEQMFTPRMVEAMVAEYGDKPATIGEAGFILHERVVDLLGRLPFVGRYIA